jgi:three-Cys-motif partner protein
MAYKDLHQEPFDEGTISKLEIFEDYAQAWIPTFVMSGVKTICIFDFFAGTGYDKNNIAGSPIRVLQKIKEHIGNIYQKGVKIKVFFNEFEPNKIEQVKFNLLKSACEQYLSENKSLRGVTEIEYHNEDSEQLFFKLLITIKNFPSLVYLDQNGIKFLSDKYFLELTKLRQTDFLYFVSSSYFWRFGEESEFKSHLNIPDIKNNPYKFIHRTIIEYLRKKIAFDNKVKLYPFSIKKKGNIYGIIFGASHPRAVDKFLTIAWRKNETNGEANFDIDDDASKIQGDLFEEKKPSKVEGFKRKIEKLILEGRIKNNKEAYDWTLGQGHIANHASEVLKNMKNKNLVTFHNNSPLINYDNVYKNGKIIEYKILK